MVSDTSTCHQGMVCVSQHLGEGLLYLTGAFALHLHNPPLVTPSWQLLFQSLSGRAHSSLEDTPVQAPQMKKGNLANSFPFWSLPLAIYKGSPSFLNVTIWPPNQCTPPKENSLKDPRTGSATTLGESHTICCSLGQQIGVWEWKYLIFSSCFLTIENTKRKYGN